MTKWETCQIELITLREFKLKIVDFILFSKDIYIPGNYQWVARMIDSSGSQTIYKSEEFQESVPQDEKFYKKGYKQGEYRNSLYQKLIAHLSREGWEPAATDQSGHITLMKRQIAESDSRTATDSTLLLQQLANLRDAGILTEPEFQMKKTEILKRM